MSTIMGWCITGQHDKCPVVKETWYDQEILCKCECHKKED